MCTYTKVFPVLFSSQWFEDGIKTFDYKCIPNIQHVAHNRTDLCEIVDLVKMFHNSKSFSLSFCKCSLSLTSSSLAWVQIGHSIVCQTAKGLIICMDWFQREFTFEKKKLGVCWCVCMCKRDQEIRRVLTCQYSLESHWLAVSNQTLDDACSWGLLLYSPQS